MIIVFEIQTHNKIHNVLHCARELIQQCNILLMSIQYILHNVLKNIFLITINSTV